MTFDEYTHVFDLMLETQARVDGFVDTLPNHVGVFMLDNDVTEAYSLLNDRLLDFIFRDDKELLEHTYWYIYDARNNSNPEKLLVDGKLVPCNTKYEFLQATKTLYF